MEREVLPLLRRVERDWAALAISSGSIMPSWLVSRALMTGGRRRWGRSPGEGEASLVPDVAGAFWSSGGGGGGFWESGLSICPSVPVVPASGGGGPW